MEKAKKILKEVHLYSDKIEMLIKLVIWTISWIGSIYILQDVQEKASLGSAYFIFGLSLLMEFTNKINNKNEFLSKFIHTIFCSIILVVVFISITVIFKRTASDLQLDIMYKCTCFILGYMGIDFIILWLSKNEISVNNKKQAINTDDNILQIQRLFNENFKGGNLGSIEKGEKCNE